LGKDLEVQLLVELRQLTLGRSDEEFGGQRCQDAVIAGGVIAQRLLQHRGHETGVAGAGKQMVQAGEQLLAAGVFGGESGANARAQRDQFLTPQLLDQARITGKHHAQERLRIESRTGQETQLAKHWRTHLLRFIDQQHRALLVAAKNRGNLARKDGGEWLTVEVDKKGAD
jgi:hypothetical protein